MKTLIICHDGAHLSRYGVSRWLASFSDLVGIIVLKEKKQRVYKRIRREVRRVGLVRFMDVVAFRVYYKLFLASRDGSVEQALLRHLRATYPEVPDIPILETHSPNSKESEAFIRGLEPDIVIARCKTLIKKTVFSIPSKGTFVMHPGICPEYRNAHGCFWALASDDLENVGMTLLKIDSGVDTGPVFGYFTYDFDEIDESHVVIQNRVVFENLPQLQDMLVSVYEGDAHPLSTAGRTSKTWGQPWLTAYLRWKFKARSRQR